jgi:hypothetical protein
MMSQPVSQFGGGCEERQGVEVEVAGAGPQPHREVSPNGQKSQHFVFSFNAWQPMTEPFGQPLTYACRGIKSIATERFSHLPERKKENVYRGNELI